MENKQKKQLGIGITIAVIIIGIFVITRPSYEIPHWNHTNGDYTIVRRNVSQTDLNFALLYYPSGTITVDLDIQYGDGATMEGINGIFCVWTFNVYGLAFSNDCQMITFVFSDGLHINVYP